MKRVGLVTDRDNKKLSPSDQLLIEPLERYGLIAEPVVWDDKKTDWESFDRLIIRSCWNYYRQYEKWLDWLDNLKAKNIIVWNQIEVMKWNSHKSYLLDLEQKGVKIIPTRIAKAGERVEDEDLVIKPLVGARAHNLKRTQKIKLKEDSLVQPFVSEIQEGEYSLVFVNNKYSHGVIKKPKKKDYRVNFAFGGTAQLIEVPREYIVTAEEILNLIPSRLLYARVDGVIKNYEFLLMELELIEPHLFFDLYPNGAVNMVKALEKFNRMDPGAEAGMTNN